MSTVPAVLAALATLGVATLTSSQVINGPAGSVTTTTGRLLLIGDQDFDVEDEFDSVAEVSTTEHYVVPCAIAADLSTPDQSVADAQAWADFAVFRLMVAADPTLGLSGSYSLHAAVVGVKTFRRAATSEGRSSLIRFGIDVFAAQS